MAVSNQSRFTIGNTQPKFNANKFKGLSSNSPIGGDQLQSLTLSVDDFLASISQALGIVASFDLSKADLLQALLDGMGIDIASILGNLLNKLVNLLDLTLLQALEARINRMMDFIAPDSELCKLLQSIDEIPELQLGKLDLILAGFISLSYDICDSDILDKLIGNITDENVRISILIKLIIDVGTSGNSNLLIAIINNKYAYNLGATVPNIGELIGTTYTTNYITSYNNTTTNLSNNSRTILTGGVRPATINYNGSEITIIPGWNDNYLILNGINNVFPNLTNGNYTSIWFGNITDHFIAIILKSIIDPTPEEIINQAYTIEHNMEALLYIALINYTEINMNYINNIVASGKNIDQSLLGLIKHTRPRGFCSPHIENVIDRSYRISDDNIDLTK